MGFYESFKDEMQKAAEDRFSSPQVSEFGWSRAAAVPGRAFRPMMKGNEAVGGETMPKGYEGFPRPAPKGTMPKFKAEKHWDAAREAPGTAVHTDTGKRPYISSETGFDMAARNPGRQTPKATVVPSQFPQAAAKSRLAGEAGTLAARVLGGLPGIAATWSKPGPRLLPQ